MADIGIKYGTTVAFDVTNLGGLDSSATRVNGWTTASVDNNADNFLDYLISGSFKTATAAPGDKTTISVYAYAALNPDTPIWPDLFSSGTEGSVGLANVHDEEQRDCGMRHLWTGTVDNGAAGEVYTMPPTSLAEAFGGVPPRLWALWVVHNFGGTSELHASDNALYRTPIEGVSA